MFATTIEYGSLLTTNEENNLDNLESKLLSAMLDKKVLACKVRDFKRSIEIAI